MFGSFRSEITKSKLYDINDSPNEKGKDRNGLLYSISPIKIDVILSIAVSFTAFANTLYSGYDGLAGIILGFNKRVFILASAYLLIKLPVTYPANVYYIISFSSSGCIL